MRNRLLVVAVMAGVLAVACRTRERDHVAAAGRAVAGAPAEAPFRIVVTDTGFEAPDSVPAGRRHILFENRGSRIHEGMLIKLPDGMTPDRYLAIVKAGNSFPPGARDYSGPGLLSPGERTEQWAPVDPGRYMVMSWNGDDPTKVRVHPFVVRGDRVDDPVPPADVVLRLVDYRFELEGKLASGTRVIRVEAVGPSMHEADLFRLVDGKTPADVRRWRKNERDRGPAPAIALGGVLDSHDVRHVAWVRRSFPPGRYALHCEMPMNIGQPSGGTSHADVGMLREIDVD